MIIDIPMNLYLQNYYFLDKIKYVSQMSTIYIESTTNFDLDFDEFTDEEELFLNNRFKDFTTKRIFVNGKAQSLQSITQKGVIVSVKNSLLNLFDMHINNFEREISNINNYNDTNQNDHFDYFIEKNNINDDDTNQNDNFDSFIEKNNINDDDNTFDNLIDNTSDYEYDEYDE